MNECPNCLDNSIIPNFRNFRDKMFLRDDGNIIDAASIAAIVALCHFRRPDVSVQGDEVTLVSSRDVSQAPS